MKKNVLITGASGNLGKATVEKFLDQGYKVIAIDSPGRTFKMPGNFEMHECNLASETEAGEMIRQIAGKHETIDAALLLVGGFAVGGIKETDGPGLTKMYALNFETAYFAARPIFLQMQKQSTGGRIVLIGARPAFNAADGKKLMAYALSKSLLFKLAEYLNAEGALQNVVTSVVVPSTIDTPSNRSSMPKADFSKWVKPEEIAELMEFICSEKGKSLREPVFKIYGNS